MPTLDGTRDGGASMMGAMDHVPIIDEHTRVVDASATATWQAASDLLDVPFQGIAGRYARVVGVKSDRLFTVERSAAPYLLGLTGEHRFARYALTFSLRSLGPARTAITAHTSAAFPGIAGRLYRLAVIDSRAHVLATRYLLRRIARRAERI